MVVMKCEGGVTKQFSALHITTCIFNKLMGDVVVVVVVVVVVIFVVVVVIVFVVVVVSLIIS